MQTFIPCLANNYRSDLLISRHGDLVRLTGHPDATFTPADALLAAEAIRAAAAEILQEIYEVQDSAE